MSVLLDTNIISELRVRRRSSGPAFAWRDANEHVPKAISVITVLELEFGAERAAMQRLPHAAALRRWIEEDVLTEFADAVLPVDLEVARICARLMTIRTFPHNDALIAATAIANGLTLVTRDEQDFAGTGVTIINPWKVVST